MPITPQTNSASSLSSTIKQAPPVPAHEDPALVEMWNQTYPSEPGLNDWTYSIIECSTGGFLITGYLLITGYGQQLCSMRTDSDGNQLWNFTLPEIAKYAWNDVGYTAIEVSTGGFAIAGYTMAPSGASQDMWLIRIDSTGNHLWNRTYGGSGNDVARSIVELSDGGFAMAGITTSFGTGTQDPYLVRTNSTGHLQWERRYGTDSANEAAKSVVACSTGGFALIGHYGSLGMWLQRTNATGYPLWNKTYGGYSNYLFHGIETKDGGFAIAGDHIGSTGTPDAWLVRTNSLGDVQWTAELGNIRPNAHQPKLVLECRDGGLAMYGTYEWSGMWIARYNETGTELWYTTYGRWCEAAVECHDGGYALVGVNAQWSGDEDWWLVRVSPIQWDPPPENQNMEAGTSFSYDLHVSSAFTVTSWSLNTSQFAIDSNGVITNSVPISVGTYGISVKITDEYDEFLNCSFTVTASDTTSPVWVVDPTDQIIDYGTALSYQLQASDISGISSWTINDTVHFSISGTGLLTSESTLAAGSYGLTVTVYDAYNNPLIVTFTVTVQQEIPPPPIPGFPVTAVALGAALGLGITMVLRYRRRKR